MDYCFLCSLTGTHVILCDGCSRVFCLTCVGIDDKKIPKGAWFCATCVNRREFCDMLDRMTPAEREQVLAEVVNKTLVICMHMVITWLLRTRRIEIYI